MTTVPNYLVDTGVFILYFRGNRKAIEFLRETRQRIAALKKTQMPANGTEPEPDPASASSDS